MTGTEKQKEFAEAIMAAIEKADDDTYPRIGTDKKIVALCRDIEAGDMDSAQKKMEELDYGGNRTVQYLMDHKNRCVDAAKVIDTYKRLFYSKLQ